MIKFSINQLLNQNFVFNYSIIARTDLRFGCFNNQYAGVASKFYMSIKLRPLVTSIKKMLTITSQVAIFSGIFLTYASKRPSEYQRWFFNADSKSPIRKLGWGFFIKKDKVKTEHLDETINLLDTGPIGYDKYLEFFAMHRSSFNFFLVLTNGLFGFVSNFKEVFVKHIPDLNEWEKPTNYTRTILPSIVFITKNCYNEYYNLFRVFFKKRIICIRTFYLCEEVNINVGYCLPVNDCSKIYDICESIFKVHFYDKRLEW